MSQLPPCSGRPCSTVNSKTQNRDYFSLFFYHTGIVLAPSFATLVLMSSTALPACAFVGFGGCATMRSATVFAAISSPSRRFHSARTSAEGAHPRIPGWIRPAKRTCGMCREEQKIPSKSQIALALQSESASACNSGYSEPTLLGNVRLGSLLHYDDRKCP